MRHERCGKIIVAASPHELPLLEVLMERGRANGLQGLRKLTPAEMREREPHVRGLAGLLVSDTGIVDFAEVTRAFAKVVVRHGGEIRTRTRLHRVRQCADGVIVQSGGGEIQCRQLINCGGLEADRIARLCGVKPGLRIIPFRGEYHQLRQDRTHLVKHLVYAVPDPRLPFLGVHFTRTIHGAVIAGPNATLALGRANYRRGDFSLRDTLEMLTYPGFWLMARRHWLAGAREYHRALHKRSLVRGLQQLVPEIEPQDVGPIRSGIRAQAVELNGRFVDDFRVLRCERIIHVLNTPSPAATASIAIGRRIADHITRPQVK